MGRDKRPPIYQKQMRKMLLIGLEHLKVAVPGITLQYVALAEQIARPRSSYFKKLFFTVVLMHLPALSRCPRSFPAACPFWFAAVGHQCPWIW